MTEVELITEKIKLKESELRDEVKDSLLYFVPYITNDYNAPKHLKPIVNALEQIKKGKRKNLLICAPPQHGKSELILHFIAYYLWDNPKRRVIYTSFSNQETINRAVKAHDYCKRIGLQSDPRFDNKSEWKTMQGGGILAKSIKQGGVGRGSDLWIIDDPYGGIDDANSDKHRELIKNYWDGTVKTRRLNNTSIIVMHTRWNTEDLIGTLSDKEDFELISIPAISEIDGKEVALCPELKSLEMLQQEREENPRFFEANYQQKPLESIGNVFQRVANLTDEDDYDVRFFSIDMAYTKNSNSDYTVLLEHRKKGDEYYIHDMIRGRFEIGEIEDIINQYVGDNELLVEDNGVQKAINDNLVRNTQAWIIRRNIRGSKLARAMNAVRLWNTKKLKLKKAEWNIEFYKEIYRFTGDNSGHDDIVDALSLGANFMEEYH